MFLAFVAEFTWTWAPTLWAIFLAHFLESRLSSESLEPFIGLLAYLETKLWLKNQQFVKILPHKR